MCAVIEQDIFKLLGMYQGNDLDLLKISPEPFRQVLEINNNLLTAINEMDSNPLVTNEIYNLNSDLAEEGRAETKDLLKWDFSEDCDSVLDEGVEFRQIPAVELKKMLVLGAAAAINKLKNESNIWKFLNNKDYLPLAADQLGRINYAAELKIGYEKLVESLGLPEGEFKSILEQYANAAKEGLEVPSRTLKANRDAEGIKYLFLFVKKYLKIQFVQVKYAKQENTDVLKAIEVKMPIKHLSNELAFAVVIYFLVEVGEIEEFRKTGKAVRARLRRSDNRTKEGKNVKSELEMVNVKIVTDVGFVDDFIARITDIANSEEDTQFEVDLAEQIRDNVAENFKRPEQ